VAPTGASVLAYSDTIALGAPTATGSWTRVAYQTAPNFPTPFLARWRGRTATFSPFFPHSPWIYGPFNAPTQGDFQTPGTVGVGDAAAESAPRIQAITPNPMRFSAAIRFSVPRRERARVRVLDVAGRVKAVLLDGWAEAGERTLTWDGRGADGRKA